MTFKREKTYPKQALENNIPETNPYVPTSSGKPLSLEKKKSNCVNDFKIMFVNICRTDLLKKRFG